MTEPSYSSVVGNLVEADIPIRQLGTDGNVAVTLAAGRVIAMAFCPEAENLFWSHPQLADTQLVRYHPEKLVGGFGGDRLWFSPELDYNWDGEPRWQTLENYKTPLEMDPGRYRTIREDAESITLRAEGRLPVHGQERQVGFEVERTIRTVNSPIPRNDPLMNAVDYVGIETQHVLRLANDTRKGFIDLWHLLQVPIGAILMVPTKELGEVRARPLSYALPGDWSQAPDHIMWRYSGMARAKIGLSASVLTGRSAVFRRLEPNRWSMIVRDFPVEQKARYVDHPYGIRRTDQAFQAWDGLGFGEMEFHSPALDAEQGPRELRESDRLWAFGGSPQAIGALALRLLALDVSYILLT